MNMTQKVLKTSALVFLLLSVAFTCAMANEKPNSNFSGYLLLGGGVTSGDLSLNDASLEKNYQISSLSQDSRSFSEFIPIIAGSLNLTLPQTGTTFTIGSKQGFGLTVSQNASQYGSFSLGATYEQDEIFADPFITGADRVRTDKDTIGISFSWDSIMSSLISFNYSFENVDVDNDVLGTRNTNLQRDGKIHTFKLSSGFYQDEQNEIGVGAYLSYADMSGESFAYIGYGVDLNHKFKGRGWDIKTGVSLGYNDYKKSHDEFSKSRTDTLTSVSTSYTKYQPFGFNRIFWTAFASYDVINANINFYDTTALTVGTGIGYNF